MSVQQKTIHVNSTPITPLSQEAKETAQQELKYGNRTPQAKKYLSGLTNKQKAALLAAGIGIPALAAIAYGISHSNISGTEGTPDPQPIGGGSITPVSETEATPNTDLTADVVRYNFSPQLSSAVNDTMSFEKAFMAARNDLGMGNVFLWKGQAYNTFYKEEFDQLTDAEKEAFFDAYEKLDIHIPEVIPNSDEPIVIVDPEVPEVITEIKTNAQTGEIELTPKQVKVITEEENKYANMTDEEKIAVLASKAAAAETEAANAKGVEVPDDSTIPNPTETGIPNDGSGNTNDDCIINTVESYNEGQSSSNDLQGSDDMYDYTVN
jgi:hypothetical protein